VNSKISMMGLNIDNLTIDETVNHIDAMIQKRKSCQHVVLNASKVVLANQNPELKKIINECALINADGQSVVWASRVLGKPLKERVAGIDLMYRLLELAESKGYRVYFFGAKEAVLIKAIENFKIKYPQLIVAGYRNGYFTAADNDKIIANMAKANADILFVGFSSPQKEFWLKENMSQINIPFCMGVGGSFDVAAGVTKRAPLWMQKSGLEWFYRFAQEPGRMWKRYIIGNLRFVWYVIKAKIIGDL
jgi:N-acetylglucosaminyldiphosphoundecaprenol N-acetyl-beta-D-mannosaminyltransferase